MANDSSTGGFLVPTEGTDYSTDLNYEAIVQALIVGVTGLPGSFVRPVWQLGNPKQPTPDVNWCSIQIMDITPNDGPEIDFDAVNLVTTLSRHVDIRLSITFSGVQAQQLASQARDGLSLPQNTDSLLPFAMEYLRTEAIEATGEEIDKVWQRRFHFVLVLRRKITRTYTTLSLLSASIELDVVDPLRVSTVNVVPAAS